MKSNAFTLIELLVVISIIAVLSTIGLITFSGIQSKARDALRKTDLQKMALALEGYLLKNGKYIPPADTGVDSCQRDTNKFYQDIVPFFQGEIPKDPKDQTNYCYIAVNEGAGYRLFSKLENCPSADTIPGIDCQSERYNYLIQSEDFIAQATPPPSAPPPPPPSSPSPSPSPSPSSSPLPAKRVFVTSTTYNGNLGGLSGADQKCLDRANAANLCGGIPCAAGTWKAWLSDSTGSPSTRFSATVRSTTDPVVFKLVDRTTPIANGWTDLTTINLLRPIFLAENGASIVTGNNAVFTDTRRNGLIHASDRHCQNWTSTLSSVYHYFGNNTYTDSRWTEITTSSSCNNQRRLYCFEQ